MRVTFVGHASILIETGGIRIVSDPWWKGPCFGAQWWTYPLPAVEVVEAQPVDYVYVSHGHHDHFHPTTLRTLAPTARVLVAEGLQLAQPIRELGFTAIEVGQDEERELAPGVACRILRTDGDDSLMVVSDGRETCVNINDALHSSPRSVQERFARLLRARYAVIDYVFCGYGVASHFPNCYVIPGKDRERTAARRQHHFSRAWATVIHDLEPRFGFPFAADLVFLEEDLFWSNEATHNTKRPTEVFREAYPSSPTTVLDIAPGFVVESGRVAVDRRRQPLSAERLRTEFADAIRRVNRQDVVDSAEVDELVERLRANIRTCQPYLASFAGDYRCLIRFRNEVRGIAVIKRGGDVSVAITSGWGETASYDLIYTTRASYLLRSLTSEHGHEVLFVGSGGIFEYTRRGPVAGNLHRELIVMMRRMTSSPRPRRRGWVARARRVLKRALRTQTEDLYDLARWTVSGPV